MGVLAEIAEEVGQLKREPIPVSEIVVGLQCGGSDGMSGITANPALGAAVDILAGVGGIGILSRPRKSTAPSICSPTARRRPRSPRSSTAM